MNDVAAFCDWVYERYGYDFRDYQPNPLRKSLAMILEDRGLPDLAALRASLEAAPATFPLVLARMTVMTSTMFRNPAVFAKLVRDVFPYLRTYASLKIWHAGCSRGEEVYSMAILLKEHGLLERTRLYATDVNPEALAAARQGIYPARRLKEFARNYLAAGGSGHLSDYFELKYGYAKFSRELGDRVLFSKHDLVSDAVFGEMNLVLCRNVLIYFSPSLQQRALTLFRQSLCPGGFLCLGHSEGVLGEASRALFAPFSRQDKIFRVAGPAPEGWASPSNKLY